MNFETINNNSDLKFCTRELHYPCDLPPPPPPVDPALLCLPVSPVSPSPGRRHRASRRSPGSAPCAGVASRRSPALAPCWSPYSFSTRWRSASRGRAAASCSSRSPPSLTLRAVTPLAPVAAAAVTGMRADLRVRRCFMSHVRRGVGTCTAPCYTMLRICASKAANTRCTTYLHSSPHFSLHSFPSTPTTPLFTPPPQPAAPPPRPSTSQPPHSTSAAACPEEEANRRPGKQANSSTSGSARPAPTRTQSAAP